MPPVILWAVGILGAALAGRWLYRAGQRVNAELHPVERGDETPARSLERDPETGIYRPK